MSNILIHMDNINSFIYDKEYDDCQDLKKHLIRIRDNAAPSKNYSKGPGRRDLILLNELIVFYKVEEIGLDIYSDFLMTYPNDIVIKTGEADLLINMDGRIDDALRSYFQAILTTGKKNDPKFYNLYKRITLHEILNDKDDYTVNKLPSIKKEHYKVTKFNRYLKHLKELKKLIYTNDNKQEKEFLKSFFQVIMHKDMIEVLPLFYHKGNASILGYHQIFDYFEMLGGFNFKRVVLNDINELSNNNEYSFEGIYDFCTKVDKDFSMLLKDIYDSRSLQIKEYRDLVNIINRNTKSNSYDLIFNLIKNTNDINIIHVLHKVIINVFEFEYVKKFNNFIIKLDKEIAFKKELVSDVISISSKYYNNSKEYYEQYGSLLLEMENFELAKTYFEKISNIQDSDSAKLMKLYCSLCIMGDKGYLDYKLEDLSYIISAMKNIALNQNNNKYLYKLNDLLKLKEDPLAGISNVFVNALEGKPVLDDELQRLKRLLGDSQSAFLQSIEQVINKIDFYDNIGKTERNDFSIFKTSDASNYDIENICEYLFSKVMSKDLKAVLIHLPMLKENISKIAKNYDFELLEKEVQSVKNLENQDIYYLRVFKSKCLQLLYSGIEKNDFNVFCDYGHKYYEIINIINKKGELENVLQNLFESIVFYEFRNKIKNDPQEHFQDPYRGILNYFEEITSFDKLKEDVVYFYYLHQFFDTKGFEDRSNIKIQDLNVLEKIITLSKLISEYGNTDNLDNKRKIINTLINTTDKSIAEINNEFKHEHVGTRKFRDNYRNIITNFKRLFNYEKIKLRKKVDLDIRLLNDLEDITKDDSLHFYLTNLGDEDANNINIRVDLVKDDQIKDSKNYTLNDLRSQNSIGFNIEFKNLYVGEYVVNFVIDYIEGKENEQFSRELKITASESKDTYTRVRFNIYTTDPAGHNGKYFYGRQDEIEIIEDNLFYDGSDSIFIRGLRRVGKSSLLNKIKSNFSDRCFSIICDCQAIRANSSEELIYNAFIKKIINHFEDLNQKIDSNEVIGNKIKIDNMSFDEYVQLSGSAIDKFDNFLRDIESKVGEKIILILIDEFEGLLNVTDGDVDGLLSYFRSIAIDKSREIHFIFAGGEDIISRNEVTVTRIADSSVNIRLGFLNKNAAIELIEGPSKGLMTFRQESIDKILYYTKGHPFYIVQICSNLMRKLNAEKKKNIIYPDDVQYSVEEVLKEGLFDNIEEIIVDSCERAIIIVLGTFLSHRDEGVNIMSIIKIFKEFDIKGRYYGDDVRGSAERLVEKNILERTTIDRENYYRFSVELWRMWYRNNCVFKWNTWLKDNDIKDEFYLEKFRPVVDTREWRTLHD